MSKSANIQHKYREVCFSDLYSDDASYYSGIENFLNLRLDQEDADPDPDTKEKIYLLEDRIREATGEILTPAQQNVWALLSQGYTQEETADQLGVCQTTVHKILQGNLCYDGPEVKRYGGAIIKLRKFLDRDPECQRLLAEINPASVEPKGRAIKSSRAVPSVYRKALARQQAAELAEQERPKLAFTVVPDEPDAPAILPAIDPAPVELPVKKEEIITTATELPQPNQSIEPAICMQFEDKSKSKIKRRKSPTRLDDGITLAPSGKYQVLTSGYYLGRFDTLEAARRAKIEWATDQGRQVVYPDGMDLQDLASLPELAASPALDFIPDNCQPRPVEKEEKITETLGLRELIKSKIKSKVSAWISAW